MGARQSYLYIFLEYKDGKYGERLDTNFGYEVTATKGAYTGCDGFEVVTHDIKYTPEDSMSFDIYIYNSRKIASKASYIFAYCSPRVTTHVVKNVKAYYSVLAPHNPLVISFHRATDDFNCDIDKLRKEGWDWAKNISEYHDGELTKLLKEQYKKFAWERTVEFDEKDKPSKDVIVFLRDIGDINYRVVFIPNDGDPVLNIKCLFTYNNKLGHGTEQLISQGVCQTSDTTAKNKIDTYFLDTVRQKKYFHGIVVYYVRDKVKNGASSDEKHEDTALLVEFINSCSTISLKRKDKDGCWWAEEKITYTDLDSRVKALKSIKDDADSDKVNTVILEKDSNYSCGRQVQSDSSKGDYIKYTHTFNTAKNPNLLFGKKQIKIESLNLSEIQAKNVEVYYLKAGQKKDDKPFIIAFVKEGSGKPDKVYHFINDGDFKKWQELKPADKLEEKLNRIARDGGCTDDLHWLKKLAYKILTSEETLPRPDPPKPTDPVRPTTDAEPEQPPPGPDWWLIIGCSVGAFLLIVALAIGYAIYWYNTTIRLLT